MASKGKAASTSKSILGKSEFKNGKLDSSSPLAQPSKCPECASQKVWRDGLRYTKYGDVQRWLCRSCGRRFSQPSIKLDVLRQLGEFPYSGTQLAHSGVEGRNLASEEGFSDSSFSGRENVGSHSTPVVGKGLYALHSNSSKRRVCASERGAKNLVKVESRIEKRVAGATKLDQATIKGRIVEYVWWLKKEGYAESTITRRSKLLKTLSKRGANLLDPESVKETIAQQVDWCNTTKEHAITAYTSFLKAQGKEWNKPKYKRIRKLPFIPTETEIDQLLASCNIKTAAFLQLLKETAARRGEAWRLEWTDFDFESQVVRITSEKGGNPRQLKISGKLISMLRLLPRNSPRPFNGSLRHFARSYRRQRKKATYKLQNQRISKITFHTLRHWKATMEYHKTKDILHVKQLLGHRNIQNTTKYTQLVNFESDQYTCRVAESLEEAKNLIEVGFDYVTDIDTKKLFRKPK